jgi:hypothetical protein
MSKYKEITKGGKILKLGSHYVRGLESSKFHPNYCLHAICIVQVGFFSNDAKNC